MENVEWIKYIVQYLTEIILIHISLEYLNKMHASGIFPRYYVHFIITFIDKNLIYFINAVFHMSE